MLDPTFTGLFKNNVLLCGSSTGLLISLFFQSQHLFTVMDILSGTQQEHLSFCLDSCLICSKLLVQNTLSYGLHVVFDFHLYLNVFYLNKYTGCFSHNIYVR